MVRLNSCWLQYEVCHLFNGRRKSIKTFMKNFSNHSCRMILAFHCPFRMLHSKQSYLATALVVRVIYITHLLLYVITCIFNALYGVSHCCVCLAKPHQSPFVLNIAENTTKRLFTCYSKVETRLRDYMSIAL